MNDPARLQRLAAYLEQDPANAALLAEACDAAIACGRHEQAEGYLARAGRLAVDDAAWQFRGARIALARGDLPRAAERLEHALARTGEHPVLAHDLAWVRLLQGDAGASLALVLPWLAPPRSDALAAGDAGALQALWLRAMQALQRLEEALEWARAQSDAGTLQPAASGVAALVAADLDEPATSIGFAQAALAADADHPEALLARGCVALAGGDSAEARQWLQRAVQCRPQEGRAWSTLGLASLHAQDLPAARSQLERAVGTLTDHVGTWHALGWTRVLQGEREAALAAFRQALAIDPGDAEAHAALALALALDGESAESRQRLEAAWRLDAGNATARHARAVLGRGAAR